MPESGPWASRSGKPWLDAASIACRVGSLAYVKNLEIGFSLVFMRVEWVTNSPVPDSYVLEERLSRVEIRG